MDGPESPAAKAQRALGSHGQPINDGVARQMSELARTMDEESDAHQMLSHIVAAAITDISGAMYAGLSLFTEAGVFTDAASDPLVEKVDSAQYASGEGPCLDAGTHHRVVRANDLTDEQRWPEFAARAVELGINSMLAVHLFSEDDSIGALNLYSTEIGAFDDDDENTALLIGVHAAIAMSSARQRENFAIALTSRDLIGQAKGILMERHKIGSQQAFEMLVWASQHSHTKLRGVAETLAETGEFVI